VQLFRRSRLGRLSPTLGSHAPPDSSAALLASGIGAASRRGGIDDRDRSDVEIDPEADVGRRLTTQGSSNAGDATARGTRPCSYQPRSDSGSGWGGGRESNGASPRVTANGTFADRTRRVNGCNAGAPIVAARALQTREQPAKFPTPSSRRMQPSHRQDSDDWTNEEDRVLCDMVEKRFLPCYVAKRLERPESAVIARAGELRLAFQPPRSRALELQALVFFAGCTLVCAFVTVAAPAGLVRGGAILGIVTFVGMLVGLRNTIRMAQWMRASAARRNELGVAGQ
jgi:hypothetical protein